MKRYLVIAAALSLLAYFSCGACLAQEEAAEEAVAEEKEMEFSWGKVNSVSSDQIIVTEYDYSIEEEAKTTYIIAPNVKLYNVNSLKDIVAGNDVWIGYVISEDKKVAMSIEVQKSSYQDEYAPEGTNEEESKDSLDETAEPEAPMSEEIEFE